MLPHLLDQFIYRQLAQIPMPLFRVVPHTGLGEHRIAKSASMTKVLHQDLPPQRA